MKDKEVQREKRLPIFESEEWLEWTVVALTARIKKDRRQISDELYLLYRGMFANA
ncbi:MAG: hypothetical protein WC279_13640 [Sulfurimonas sp.]|jgi:hypothetical protein|uniref:hypothetical protein n=1 Tax=Sulfurimonas sp. TaxID=2022749 RepID=UPI00356A7FB7